MTSKDKIIRQFIKYVDNLEAYCRKSALYFMN